jgi:hypothetical protein
MAHYAWLDENNVVINVSVGIDETELIDGLDTETFYSQASGYNIKRTSYNAKINGFRYNYAGIGYTYDPIDDAFIAPMPACGHDALLLNDLKRWECATCEANFEQSRPTA